MQGSHAADGKDQAVGPQGEVPEWSLGYHSPQVHGTPGPLEPPKCTLEVGI